MKTPVKIAIAAGVVAVATPVVWLGWQILAGLHAERQLEAKRRHAGEAAVKMRAGGGLP